MTPKIRKSNRFYLKTANYSIFGSLKSGRHLYDADCLFKPLKPVILEKMALHMNTSQYVKQSGKPLPTGVLLFQNLTGTKTKVFMQDQVNRVPITQENGSLSV